MAECLLMGVGICAAAQNSGHPFEIHLTAWRFSPLPVAAVQNNKHNRRVSVPVEESQPAELGKAEFAIERKDYAAAELILEKFVAEQPANYVGWFDLGFVKNALGEVESSIAAYRRSVAAKPDVFESNLNLGLQLAKTGQPDAENFLQAATLLTPTSHVAESRYRAWLSLAHVHEQSRPKEALADYEKAATLQPQEADPHLSEGRLLEQENKSSEAEREYKKALALDASSKDAVIGLANIYMRAGRYAEAEESLRKLQAADANSASVHIQLGRVLAAQGNTDAAIAEIQQGVKLAPKDEAAHRDLAELYTTAAKYDLAETAYHNLLLDHPNDSDLHRALGKSLLHQKKFPQAQQEFLSAIKLKPEAGEVYGDLAFAASENKEYALVIRALKERSERLPDNPVTYFLKASALDHLHDYKKAAVNFHLFLQTANGQYPDYEWQAKHRLIAIERRK